jgi:hypothetical protein
MVVEYDDGNVSYSEPVGVEIWIMWGDVAGYDYSTLAFLAIVSFILIFAMVFAYAQRRKRD